MSELQKGKIPAGQPCPFSDGRCAIVADCHRPEYMDRRFSCGWARALDLGTEGPRLADLREKFKGIPEVSGRMPED